MVAKFIDILCLMLLTTASAFADEMSLESTGYMGRAPGAPSFSHLMPTKDTRIFVYDSNTKQNGLLFTFAVPSWESENKIDKALSCSVSVITSTSGNALEVGYIIGYREWNTINIINNTNFDVKSCMTALKKIQDGNSRITFNAEAIAVLPGQ